MKIRGFHMSEKSRVARPHVEWVATSLDNWVLRFPGDSEKPLAIARIWAKRGGGWESSVLRTYNVNRSCGEIHEAQALVEKRLEEGGFPEEWLP